MCHGGRRPATHAQKMENTTVYVVKNLLSTLERFHNERVEPMT